MSHITITTIAIACAMICVACKPGSTRSEQKYIDTQPMLITQVQRCSRLYTAEYCVRKIVTYDDVKHLRGNAFNHDFDIALPLGDRKIAIPIEATLKAWVDFYGFGPDNVRRDGNKITIVLPDPKVSLTATKIDHANIKQYVSATRSRFSDSEMAELQRQGRQAIIDAIGQMGIVETSRHNAARVLVPIIKQLGYDEANITITFRHDLKEADIGVLLGNTSGF